MKIIKNLNLLHVNPLNVYCPLKTKNTTIAQRLQRFILLNMQVVSHNNYHQLQRSTNLQNLKETLQHARFFMSQTL